MDQTSLHFQILPKEGQENPGGGGIKLCPEMMRVSLRFFTLVKNSPDFENIISESNSMCTNFIYFLIFLIFFK